MRARASPGLAPFCACVSAALALATACVAPVHGAHGIHGVGDAPQAPAGNVAGSAHALCEAECARNARCGGGPCACDGVVDTHVLRADWSRADAACLARATCLGDGAEDGDGGADTSDGEDARDACARAASRVIGITALAWPPVVLRCLAKGDSCGGSFAACRRLAALTDEARAEADACFAHGCADYRACFASFWGARVAPAVPVWRGSTR